MSKMEFVDTLEAEKFKNKSVYSFAGQPANPIGQYGQVKQHIFCPMSVRDELHSCVLLSQICDTQKTLQFHIYFQHHFISKFLE